MNAFTKRRDEAVTSFEEKTREVADQILSENGEERRPVRSRHIPKELIEEYSEVLRSRGRISADRWLAKQHTSSRP
jgi:hypothetical protein